MEGKTTHISLCRPGGEALLAEELRQTVRPAPRVLAAPPGVPGTGSGWLAWQVERPGTEPAPGALAFERQRLPAAAYVPDGGLAALAIALWAAAAAGLRGTTGPHGLHCFAADPTGERSMSGRAVRLERLLKDNADADLGAGVLLSAERFRAEASTRSRGRLVWQVCLVSGGAWWALTLAQALADPYPGGVHRMTREAGAPSRSYLKIEEALEVLGQPPRPRERVIDLGAAPGGWSYAFLQRGCRVLAVDNGPLKLPGLDALPGELTHLRSDGLRLRPPPGWVPADWLLSDMLIAPGVCLGLLRKWIEGGWMRRFIVNVKLPQREPLAALKPLREYLAGVPGLVWRMRQLYHDRREVTVMGELANPRPAHGTAHSASSRPPRGNIRPRGPGSPSHATPRRARSPRAGRRHAPTRRP
ncbi:MAG TPA: SAM-dependent methyltransferase [bacterium]|nr:SAM-dependent methyltransferase [bacterium]